MGDLFALTISSTMPREHFFSNKTEAGVQLFCAIVYFIGLILVGKQANDTEALKDLKESITFTFAVGLLLILALVYNAAVHTPSVTPMLIGLGFWFCCNSIATLDSFAQLKKDPNFTFDNYDMLLAGGVLCTMSVAVALIFEISVPSLTGRDGAVGAPEVTAILCTFLSAVGLLLVWINIDYTKFTQFAAQSSAGFSSTTYTSIMTLSL